ncbi:MAG: 23S rRNA (pseudouridine(1915)-N(3))-methyltransferase RlmH [Lentimicrobium sp.]|jgi:23S rRNA (pseudouridine1915-N3)-methyltransferase|nr:23S rRNA (pseudouridine(1915)-N(3))-methyltransferase RlmH [Lentimicrobium sp.]MDD2526743.1 23S rRNA (pseudouridine(1915)-N(3))-methyltransferase RlmH [Lentimicrobiaceae bacterium]MDD4596467.1 23S rRNA (pseudouridine(1915)-N(3))-methyltransferase RlmH [Lentimicrobiaceae bacterium]MDY0024709.1 23S rRNA (pseudouridine(1915)-N(3))-methyltransferase RlmH [Lentimicrobium sp.]HAH57858.1 23S rRNA (pseudouridine(1915)-N(3))-methyltransferase RlmH [Bacteroidales bacterium]
MKITLLVVGKTAETWTHEGFAAYEKRLKHYIRFNYQEVILPKNIRSSEAAQLRETEGQWLMKYVQQGDQVCLLDEKGSSYTSMQFADWIQRQMNAGVKHLIFVVGGAFGFSEDLYRFAQYKISLSPMTFSHQLVRPVFAEQLYRAFTILRNEPYHNP